MHLCSSYGTIAACPGVRDKFLWKSNDAYFVGATFRRENKTAMNVAVAREKVLQPGFWSCSKNERQKHERQT